MRTVRVRFSKHGRAKFISHLDLNRCMSRALRRAGVPVWYTQGFNPHPHVVFALALSLFYESDWELMDIRLDGEMADAEIVRRLGEQMPEGIAIVGAAAPVRPLGELGWAGYRVTLDYDGCPAVRLREAVRSLSERSPLLYEKPTKHGTRPVDIRPFWQTADFSAGDGELEISIVLPASPAENVNPVCLPAVLTQYAGLKPDFDQVTRTALYDAGRRPFV